MEDATMSQQSDTTEATTATQVIDAIDEALMAVAEGRSGYSEFVDTMADLVGTFRREQAQAIETMERSRAGESTAPVGRKARYVIRRAGTQIGDRYISVLSKHGHGWISDPAKARTFATDQAALNAIDRHRLTGVDVVAIEA
jgi:hypothetical protein